MKSLIAFFFILLAACQPSSSSGDKPRRMVYEKGVVEVGDELRHYLVAPDFDPDSKECWQTIQNFSKSKDAPKGLAKGNHLLVFVDTEEFAIPKNGEIPDAEVQHVLAKQTIKEDYEVFMIGLAFMGRANL
jgi:hypothetical protein